jgi:hypothetical protein
LCDMNPSLCVESCVLAVVLVRYHGGTQAPDTPSTRSTCMGAVTKHKLVTWSQSFNRHDSVVYRCYNFHTCKLQQ